MQEWFYQSRSQNRLSFSASTSPNSQYSSAARVEKLPDALGRRLSFYIPVNNLKIEMNWWTSTETVDVQGDTKISN